ncbi:MAG: hypothetical protein Phyf2KO_06570 [Phycisphaerales bacterium]
MSNRYVLVQWNSHKKIYDVVTLAGMVLFLAAYVGAGLIRHPAPSEISPPILLLRGFGVLAIAMLHIILSIGPLARLDERFTPLLYNRRHLGVMFFAVAFLHGFMVIGFYGGFGGLNPFSSVLNSQGGGVPFELLGFLALIIFFVMAATSHDFWLANLGHRFWKAMHMCVYAAYAMVVLHVAFGAMQDKQGATSSALLAVGVVWLGGLHIAAGMKQRKADNANTQAVEGWIYVCEVNEIPTSRARVVRQAGREAVAVVNNGGTITAVSNVCAHQGGPLGEGQVIDGCLTCPWHGYQYDPATGCSPPPYTERVRTYEVRVEGNRVLLNPEHRDG